MVTVPASSARIASTRSAISAIESLRGDDVVGQVVAFAGVRVEEGVDEVRFLGFVSPGELADRPLPSEPAVTSS